MKKLLVFFAICFLCHTVYGEETTAWRTVVRVVDGDTIELDNKEKVRLIGVDTPEKYDSKKLNRDAEHTGQDKETIKLLGEIASAYVVGLCEGQRVRLEYGQEQTDKYGRTLAYLYLQDGRMVNREIIRNGYGAAYTVFPFKYKDEFVELAAKAREGNKGLYHIEIKEKNPSQDMNANNTVYVTPSGKKYHRKGCSFLNNNSKALPLSEAKKTYSPCSKCNPE